MARKEEIIAHHFEMNNPVRQYSLQNSTSLPKVMLELIEETSKVPHGMMMGRPEVLSLNMVLMKSIQAKKVLDVGVFTGLSALAAALCIPDSGRVIACDVYDDYINKLGRKYWSKAGVEHKIDVRIDYAANSLEKLVKTPGELETFDFAFIDADKQNYNVYYELTLKLLRKGGIIAFDNVLWGGSVLNPSDNVSQYLVNLNKKLSQDPRITTSLISIGDGLLIVYKN